MIKICPTHGEYEVQNLNFFSSIIEAGCPQCVQIELDRQAEKEKADRMKAEIGLYKAMNIEPAYYGSTLDNFETLTTDQAKAKSTIARLIQGELLKIIMTGKNGTGKTHLACSAVKALRGRIMTMYEISTTIRASYTSLAKKTELELVDELASIPILVIDEVGRTKGSDTELNWLSYIVDKRHVRKLPLIIISNNHVKKDCPNKGCEKCLENYMGEDVMSRLAAGSVLLRFNGEDYRKK
jgi:DNA replication protein DnaC